MNTVKNKKFVIRVGKDNNKNKENKIDFLFDITFLDEYIEVCENGKQRIRYKLSVTPVINGKISSKNIKYVNENINDYITSIKWTSSNTNIATVNKRGEVQGKRAGDCKITLTINNEFSKSINTQVKQRIIFKDKLVEKISLLNWDSNHDGVLSVSEFNNVANHQIPYIIFVNSNITSFDEFQYMTNVTEIQHDSFNNCDRMTSITLPDSITTIGDNAFEHCSSLTDIYVNSLIPPEIGDDIFDDCENLFTIHVPEESLDLYMNDEKWKEYISYLNNTGFDYTFDFILS